ncbi:integrase [Ahniella affigens]|uniref:Integrase n=1 Tax=Ahniella affigens TaxID=2021234 RepID=A0A2P1PYU9_9GAMM|nr:integrase [Ahniella affigens]
MQSGVDPGEQRKAEREATQNDVRGTFAAVCADWLAFKRPGWSPDSFRKADLVTRSYLLPKLGPLPIATLASKDCTPVLRAMAEKAPEMARKAREYLSAIVRHAMRDGLREEGRMLVLDGILPKMDKGHIPAATLPDQIGDLMRAIRDYPGEIVRAGLLMCAYTAQRPGMVASMRWSEIAPDAAEWRIPPERMKKRNAHIVPLPTQALALLERMRELRFSREFVFPPVARQSTPHLHRDALSKALRSMGFSGQHATHGFRGMLRTAGRERLAIPADVLEAQLAHAKKDAIQKAYDRTAFNDERVRTMQRWADWLDGLDLPASVTPIHAKRAGS